MRRFVVCALVVALACLSSGTAPQAQTTKPNILLIQADDLGYGDLSIYGQAMFQTPNVDRLARNGLRFIRYYAGSTVCAPSRAALMTGLHTGHAWIRGNVAGMSLRDEDRTIASLLKDAGYRTALIGKWGLGESESPGRPDRKGFEYSFGYLSQTHAHRQFTDHLYRNGQRVEVSQDDYSNDLFTRETMAFIEKNDTRPFFIYLNYTVPHAELRVPDDSMAPFKGHFPEKPFVNAAADARATGPDEPSLGYRSQPTPHAAFAAMVTRMDRDVGRIVDLLHARGLDQRTLVIFTSDNGPHQEGGGDPEFFKSSGGLRGIKRDLYEGGIRVPMIASWPGTIAAGTSTVYAAAHWDLFPTFAELAGCAGAVRSRWQIDRSNSSRRAAASARIHVLGISRARLSTGGADGQLEGRATGEGQAARTVQSRRRSNGVHRRRLEASGRGCANRGLPEDGSNRVAELADQVAISLQLSAFRDGGFRDMATAQS